MDLNKGAQIFDVVLKQVLVENGILTYRKQLELEPCTRQHWQMDPVTISKDDEMGIDSWQCLKLNGGVNFTGMYGSSVYQHLQYQIYPCKNTTQNKNKCAPQSYIDEMFYNYTNFYFTVSFMNANINPNQPSYIEYSLNNENYFIISKEIGV